MDGVKNRDRPCGDNQRYAETGLAGAIREREREEKLDSLCAPRAREGESEHQKYTQRKRGGRELAIVEVS